MNNFLNLIYLICYKPQNSFTRLCTRLQNILVDVSEISDLMLTLSKFFYLFTYSLQNVPQTRDKISKHWIRLGTLELNQLLTLTEWCITMATRCCSSHRISCKSACTRKECDKPGAAVHADKWQELWGSTANSRLCLRQQSTAVRPRLNDPDWESPLADVVTGLTPRWVGLSVVSAWNEV